MKRKKHKPISQAEQSRRFIEAAQQAGVSTDEEVLKKVIRRIAAAPRHSRPPSKVKK